MAAVGRKGEAVRAGKTPRMKAAKKVSKATKAAKMTKPKRAAKRLLAVANQAVVAEAARRTRHLKALSYASGAERELEDLIFGDSLYVEEDELLRRLAGPRRVWHIQARALPDPTAAAPAGVRCSLRPRVLGPWGPSRVPGHTARSVVFRLVLQRGKASRKSPAIRGWKMKRKETYCPKSRHGWMRMTKPRKSKFRLIFTPQGDENYVSYLGVNVSGLGLNNLCVLCVFPV